MRTRRLFLATGLVALIVSAGHRARAVGVEAEGAVYGGQTSGGWICGPTGTARYGGVGTEVTVAQRDRSDEKGRGLLVDAAVGAERESVTTAPCVSAYCTGAQPGDLPDRLMFGGRLRGGYEGRYFGFQGGAGLYQGWESANSVHPAITVYPDLSVSFGWLHRIYSTVGFGTPLVTQLLRPGLYGGFGGATKSGLGLDLLAGLFRQGPASFDAAGLRVDLVGRAPIPWTKNLYLRAGGSVGVPSGAPLDFEGSLGLAAGY